MLMPSARREVTEQLVQSSVPVMRACRITGLSRAAYYKRAEPLQRDGRLIDALNAIVSRHNRWGFWECYRRLRLDGLGWNHKRVYRVYCAMGLNLPRRGKKMLAQRLRLPLGWATEPNCCWPLDFMHDALYWHTVSHVECD